MFELTYRCNFFCRHCYLPQRYRRKGELKTEKIFSILDQLKDIGCFYLGFTGGEPFTRQDIMDILWYSKKKGFEIIIYTNGSFIDEKIADELHRLRPNKVDITIPAMSKDAFERISGVAGSRDKVFKGIDLLHENQVNLGFKTCVLKENENEIERIQDFAGSLGALHRLDDVFSPRLDGSREPYRYRGEMADDRSHSSEVRSQKTEDRGEKTNVTSKRLEAKTHSRFDTCGLDAFTANKQRKPKSENPFKCGVGVSQAAITPSGELKMCLMIDYPKYKILNGEDARRKTEGRAEKTNLEYAWKELKELVGSIKPDKDYKCDMCELEPYCKWCPARGWLDNKSFTSCDPESRRWAEIRRQRLENSGK